MEPLCSACETTRWGQPPAMGSADGEASLELLESSFITGPHMWAKNFQGNKAISFLLDLGPAQDALMLQAAGLCGEEGPSASRKGPWPPSPDS